MKLDVTEEKKRKNIHKCFKYDKLKHICRFCKSKITEVLNPKEKSENNELLTSEKSQKKEL